ncbi:MAG TPA: histidine--tRNA ligase [Polyangiaceae bacterium]|nr:histidine--tRNA ligase [Polyangiaceae bacterium]
MTLRAVKGMNDILPDEIGRWHALEAVLRRTFELAGYREIRTPVLEPTELFVRSIGEATEIVEKQMFILKREDESLALRPEGTAGVARAYVGSTLHNREPVSRLYYLGPMFRAERPQRGRYRQFWQAGVEIYGDPGPGCDAELIDMLVRMLSGLGVQNLRVLVNSLGGTETRARYREALAAYLRPKSAELSEHARRRLEDNPLRILDSKNPQDQAAVAGAPSILELLTPEDRAHFEGVTRGLGALGTPFEVSPGLVRGLDYYTRTLFEIQTTGAEIGSQNALLGGGRYDAMVKELGGPDVPAIGFALGLERVLLALPAAAAASEPRCFVAPLGERAQVEALVIARELREAGVPAEADTRGGSLKSLLRRADGTGSRLCIVLGDNEIERGIVTLKDLAARSQIEVPRAEVVLRAKSLLASAPPAGSSGA